MSQNVSLNVINKVFDPGKLLQAIRKYRTLDLKSIEIKDVDELFENFFKQFNLKVLNIGGIPLFRARKIEPNKEHDLRKDVWCPPADIAKMNRANDVGEPVFYAALDPVTAVKEVGLVQGDRFSLAIYDLIPDEKNVHSTVVITIPEQVDGNWGENMRLHAMILCDFMFSEFTRQVGKGTEFQYKASCAIAKRLFSIPHHDSLLYPSMQNYKKWNIVIPESTAKSRLRLKRVMCCQIDKLLDTETIFIDIEKDSNLVMDGELSETIPYNQVSNAKEMELSYETFLNNRSNLFISELNEFYN